MYYGDKEIGRTTSGTHSPYLGYPIAMALIDMDGLDDNINNIATKLEVDVREEGLMQRCSPTIL